MGQLWASLYFWGPQASLAYRLLTSPYHAPLLMFGSNSSFYEDSSHMGSGPTLVTQLSV